MSLTHGTLFDHTADGFAELTGWVGTDDGLLVRDLDGNGIIDSGRELFGSETLLPNGLKATNGFEALRELDTNSDGVIDTADSAFGELRVWKGSEFLILGEAGVSSINLAYAHSSHIDAQGNEHRQVGSYTTTSGETRTATDIWVQTNATQSLPTDWVDVPEDIAALPDAQGYGLVRDLHQAMAMDASGELKGLVEAFTQATTPQERDLLVTQLIYHWTGVQDIDPASRASKMIYGNAIGDARKLEALEAFMGEEWVGVWCWGTRDPNPHGRAAPVLLQAWDELKALVYGQLMAQTQLQGLFQQINYQWDAELEEVVGDLSGVAQALAQRIEADRDAGLDALGDFLYSLKGMGLLDRLNVDDFRVALGALGGDVVATMDAALRGWVANGATDGADVLRGTDAADVIDGRAGNDRLLGRGGNDVLVGGAGNDVLDGGTGLDDLRGGAGSDTYVYGRGDGHDTLTEDPWRAGAGDIDRIQLKAGVSADDVRLQRVRTGTYWEMQDDLVLTIRETGETITVRNHFDDSQPYAVEEIAFADGTVWDADAIRSRVLLGEDEDEALEGFAGRDNAIEGGAGNDRLIGAGGDDTLDGGSGDDRLEGGQGSDTYRYGQGDGQDSIKEDTWIAGETDRIELKAGVSADNVRLQRVRTGSGWQMQDNLVLTLRDSGETLAVTNHFNASQRHAVEEIVFADGTVWDAEAIRARVLLGEAEDEDLQGFAGRDNVISGGAGNDHLRGRAGNDTLDGGTGNDVLEGGMGSDAYHHRLGDGVDRITENWDPGSTDVLHLAEGISPGDVRLHWTAQRDLRVVLPGSGQVLVAQQATPQDQGSGYGIEAIEFADGTRWGLEEMYARTAQTTDGDDDLVLGAQDDLVDGGAGNDRFTSLGGRDTFLFGLGDGHDEMGESQGTLRFKAGIDQNGVRFTQEGTDLVVTLSASGDSVRLKNWSGAWSRVDRFEFDNGTVFGSWQVEALLSAGNEAQLLFGSPGNDTLTTSGPNATVYAGDGEDRVQGDAARNALYGEAGNDALTGGQGDDVLSGGDGDDVLEGGAGRDTLQGDAGQNTYVMRRGMGLDTVRVESLATAQDVVVLPEGVRPQDITVGLSLSGPIDAVQDENSVFDRLVIGIGQNDALVIEGFDPVTAERLDVMQQAVQTFRFADGTALTLNELLALSSPGRLGDHYLGRQSAVDIQGSAGEDDIVEWYGHAPTRRVSAGDNDDRVSVGRNDHLVSGGWGNDDITTMGGADVVAGDAGDDFIRTGSQDDVVLFNRGDGHDRVHFGKGTDTLSFGAGIEPGDLSVALSHEGDWLILVDGGAGGSVQVRPIDLDDPTNTNTDSLRLQFISATGEARVHDFTAWVQQNQNALQATSPASAIAFDGAGVDISSRTPMAGGLAAVAHAQTGDLLGTAILVRALPSELDDWIHGTDDADAINAGGGNDHVMGHGGNDALLGGAGNDVLSGGEGDDVLEGGAGDDVLSGDGGSDVLWGGGGTDVLKGGMGGDTYRFELGDGNVTIEDGHELMEGFGSSGFDDEEEEGDRIDSAPNVLAFGTGISAQDLVYTEVGNDLVITLRHSPQDRLVLKGFDPGRATFTRSVDVFRFQDGTEIVELDTTQVGVTEYGSDAGDWLFGTPVSDRLIGGDGDDQLFGRGGADRLAGGLGSDVYHVVASTAPDTFAQTVIAETWRPQDTNVLMIHGEVTGEDLWLALEGNDLVLRIGHGDSVRFAGFDPRAPGMPAPVERIELAETGALIHFADLLAQGVYDPDAPLPDLRVNLGDGVVDVDAGSVANTSGTLAFGEGINAIAIQSNLRFEADGNGGHWLVIRYGDTGDVLRLSGFNPSDVLSGGHVVDRFRFADGTTWDYASLVSEGFLVEGDEQVNDMAGTNLSDQLHGGDGNDVLRGGNGDDAYVFNRGDGIDTIVDSGATDFNFIRFGAGIRPDDIRQEWDGSTLIVHYSEEDAVRIADYHGSEGNPVVLALVFDDGSVISLTERMNRSPEVTADLQTASVTQDQDFQMFLPADLFHDPDAADELRVSVRLANGDALPAWLAFDPARGLLHGRPSSGDVGTLALLVQATDHFGASASQTFALEVLPGSENLPPNLNPDTASLSADATAPITGNVLHNDTDPNGDALTLLTTGAQQGILGVLTWHTDGAYTYTLDGASPALRSLGAGQSATEHFAYTTTDGQAQAQGELVITIDGVNDAPMIQRALGDVLVIKNETSTWQLPAGAFSDPDQGDSLSYAAGLADGSALPSWLTFDATTGSFLAAPPPNAQGELAVQVTATDGHGESVSQAFQVTVGNRGDRPKGNQGVGNGEDPPPPGHDDNFNDGPGTGPGNPGARNRNTAQQAAAMQTSEAIAPIEPVEWAVWNTPQETAAADAASLHMGADIEAHWQQLLATLQQLDAERNASDLWSDPALGAGHGLAGLTAEGQPVGLSGVSGVGLTAGSGTHLAGFYGLREGLASLAA